MKRLIAISGVTLALIACGISATAETKVSGITVVKPKSSFINFMIQKDIQTTMLEAEIKAKEEAQVRELRIQLALNNLEKHIGKTWYVFAGSTPDGWDCSGLVLWFHKHFGVELYHSATAQKFAGEIVTEPMVGDIVAFSHKGTEMAYHNGIYIGDGKMIHSARKGTVTSIRDISDFAKGESIITYTRINY